MLQSVAISPDRGCWRTIRCGGKPGPPLLRWHQSPATEPRLPTRASLHYLQFDEGLKPTIWAAMLSLNMIDAMQLTLAVQRASDRRFGDEEEPWASQFIGDLMDAMTQLDSCARHSTNTGGTLNTSSPSNDTNWNYDHFLPDWENILKWVAKALFPYHRQTLASGISNT